jgi:DNA-binding transcriptional ArsR family regulator
LPAIAFHYGFISARLPAVAFHHFIISTRLPAIAFRYCFVSPRLPAVAFHHGIVSTHLPAVAFGYEAVAREIAANAFRQLFIATQQKSVAMGRLNHCDFMSDLSASPPSNVVISPFAPEPVGLHAALGDEVRLGIVRELAAGAALNVRMLAGRLKRDPDLISKHLRVLREARAIVRVRPPGADGREQFYQVPEGTLRTLPDGTHEVDWQVAVARFRAG